MKIKLINYAFDDTFTNVRIFDNAEARDVFFDAQVGVTLDNVNFNINNLINTSIIFNSSAIEDNDLVKLLNYNYAIVTGNTEKMFFFIKQSAQLSGNQFRADLTLDIFNTYFYDIEFSDCLITRAHLDRFLKNEDGTYSFNGNANSNLFEREDIKNVSKRVVEKQNMTLFSKKNPEIASWLNRIRCWVYIFIAEGDYTIGTWENPTTTSNKNLQKIQYTYNLFMDEEIQKTSIFGATACLCYPIFVNDAGNGDELIVRDDAGNARKIRPESFLNFIQKNGGWSEKIKAIKISPKSPLQLEAFLYDYEISSGSLILKINHQTNDTYLTGSNTAVIPVPVQEDTGLNASALFYIKYDSYAWYQLLKPQIKLPQIKFTKDEIKQKRDLKLNPKLNSIDYKSLKISYFGSNFEFDIQKLNTETPIFKLKEMIVPDVSKILITLETDDEKSVYNSSFSKGFTGLIITNDLSLPIANGVLENYLANNKNAFLSFQNQQNYNYRTSIINALGQFGRSAAATTTNPINSVYGAINILENAGQTINKAKYQETEFNLSIDNMESAPDQLVNANGSALFGLLVESKIVCGLYSGLDAELKIANDISYENGYVFNQYGNIKKYVFTRKFFNYIEAVPDNIVGKISNAIKRQFKAILSRGVRFWHSDSINYDDENYEIFLDEENKK